jgi:hypothetical protein
LPGRLFRSLDIGFFKLSSSQFRAQITLWANVAERSKSSSSHLLCATALDADAVAGKTAWSLISTYEQPALNV